MQQLFWAQTGGFMSDVLVCLLHESACCMQLACLNAMQWGEPCFWTFCACLTLEDGGIGEGT